MPQKKPKSPNKRKFFLRAIFFAAVSLCLVQLVFANSLSAKGSEMREIENEKQQLIYENLKLKNKIAQKTSLAYISEQAKTKLGMEKAAAGNKIEFVKAEKKSLAMKN